MTFKLIDNIYHKIPIVGISENSDKNIESNSYMPMFKMTHEECKKADSENILVRLCICTNPN